MSGTVFIFPGQGSQYVSMAKDLFEAYDYVKLLFRQAEEILDFPISYQMFTGEEEVLKRTLFAQPAIFLHSAAILNILREKKITPDFAMGHSLGEITALYAAEVLTFEDAIKVVKKRAELMDSVSIGGGMSAIIGLQEDKIQAVIQKYRGKVVIANKNSPSQIVISGYISQLEKVEEELKQAGARRVIRLRVSGAFHSPLMEEVKKEFRDFLQEIEFHTPTIPVIPNVYPKPVWNAQKLKDFLVEQLTSMVNWHDGVRTVLKFRPDRFIEIGPKRVLSRLVKEIAGSEIEVYSIDRIEDLETFLNP